MDVIGISAKILVLRATVVVRRAARLRRRELERELAGYATPAERADLEALLDHHTEGDTREVRDILARQASGRGRSPWGGTGAG